MASLTIRKIEDSLKGRLRMRAARHGRSMEEEARRILRDALSDERPETLADLARKIFGPEYGVDLPEHAPVVPSPPAEFADR